ncbi:hypothetical protein N7468_008586 [Penicillium chermesinum]|uniref:SnoaL-like domain-containing protein n=1 Tax=Penicillium chermesinum TaxID=63820 RepID=A0A9W9TIS8_9EURO|nr:uncharacterized protein N7468_008586 [Penicillium chermesinum]KAJ5224044.1 hypothetical protein N7468_008586 [Penicillium chermesinum]KAJ6155140.1 hypothetical protein N7470_005706 [Penicillium chermesinum]
MSLPSLPSLPATLTPALSGRDAIADAIYRCVESFDRCDVDLCKSAFTSDAIFDLNGNAMEGIQAIIDQCFASVSKMDTTHHITGIRINILDDSKAQATCSALAQHFTSGEGLKGDGVPILVGSVYWIDFTKDSEDGLWKIKKLILKSHWAQGDWGVFSK